MVKGMQPQIEGKPNPTGTSGMAALMYKVKGKDLKMGEHAGKRVQIDGMFTHETRAQNNVSFATDLVKLEGTTLREVPGDCPKNRSDKPQPEK